MTARTVPLLIVAVVAVVAVALHAPISQPFGYHAFADQRTIFGVPRFWDVVSNLPFLFAGIAGLVLLLRGNPPGALPELRWAYLTFFAGATLVFAGSSYYHLNPNNETLLWDRLPMSIAFMAFLAAVIGEHIDPRLGIRLLLGLVVLGIVSVIWWRYTDDLRLYIVVQYLPIIEIPLIMMLFPSRLRPAGYLWGLLAAYAVAKVLELFDVPVFNAIGFVSGHTLKHIVAAIGIGIFALAMARRRPVLV
jgi:hypothetical protein